MITYNTLNDLPPGSVTVDENGMETVLVTGSNSVDWMQIALIGAILYLVFSSKNN